MDSSAIKERIKLLVAKYKAEADSGKLKKYTEEDIKKGFILPFFEALGWDTANRSEVSSEEHIKSSGRVDYCFYLDDWPKFYIEAKSVKANIHDEQWARQAIRYSWNRGVTWAVLTNFERLLVFNAQDIKSSLANKLLFDIPYTEYASEFDRLWLLSRESFATNALDDYAEKIGKKFQKIPISSLLYKDLDECRTVLTKALHSWNQNVKRDLLDEGVQRFLDRLIFIRVAEDRGVEPPTLLPLLREWGVSKTKNEVPLYASMVEKFRELDKTYNSNLFAEHPFEQWEEYGGATEQAIKILYGKEGYYEYDFKAMPADVLGTVYENYLGHRLLQSKKGVTLDKDAGKRKEQGIYYTPTFIVDYIVKHALQPVLDKCKTAEQLLKIKVLDPACGSGSFLIKALEVLNEKYKSLGYPGDERTKLLILTHNIYGVDLDEQAVEIARLNLLINSLDGKMRLPYLTDNIKCGNSLISGTDAELKKYFGANFRDKKPFNWEEEFPNVFAQGGFDVVIGNPPYLSIERGLLDDVAYFKDKYSTIEKIYDIFGLFIEKAIVLLKTNGYLGFIVPSVVLQNDSFRLLRKHILDDGKIESINNYKDGVFSGAVVPTVVMVIQKNKVSDRQEIKINLYEGNQLVREANIKQDSFRTESLYRFNISIDDNFLAIKNKVYRGAELLEKVLKIQEAMKTGDDKKFISDTGENFENKKVLLKGADINRYRILKERYVNYDKNLLKRPGKEEVFQLPEKIYIRRIADHLISVLDTKQRYAVHTLYTGVVIDKKYTYEYVLALLNSRLFTYLYLNLYPFKGDVFPEIRIGNLGKLPVKQVDLENQKTLIDLVRKIQVLNLDFNAIEKKSNEWERLKSEIEKTDKKIDEVVYKLFSLTENDIKVIEETF